MTLIGDTNTLGNGTTSDAGSYSVLVSNSLGSVEVIGNSGAKAAGQPVATGCSTTTATRIE